MSGNKIITNIGLLLLAAVLIYLGYGWLGGSDPLSDAGLTADGFSQGIDGEDPSDEFLTTLVGLQELNLKGDVFKNPVFKDLEDHSTVLVDQAPGRPNPFSPVNFEAVRSVSSRSATSSNSTSTSSR